MQGRSVFGSGLGRLGNVRAYDTHIWWGCWQRSCWVHATQDLEPNSLNWLGPHFTTPLIPKTVPTISPWILRIHSNHSKHKLPKSVKGFYLLSLLACPWLWTFYQLLGFIHKCLFIVGEKPLEGKYLSIPVPFSLSFLWMSTALPLLDLKVLYWYQKLLEGSQGSNSKDKLAPETVTRTLSFATLQHLNYLEGVIRKTHKWPVPPTSVPPYEKKICSYHRYCDYWSLLTDVTSLEMAAFCELCVWKALY